MQHKKRETKNIFMLIVLGVCWVAGILMAGSENPYMPWLNLSGLMLNGVASYLLCKIPYLKHFSEC